ncbi:hypothetical protein CUMW_139000, partial [Citrus unshiu]
MAMGKYSRVDGRKSPEDSTNGDGDDVPVEKSDNRAEDNQEEKNVSEGDGETSESKNMVNQNQEENSVKESSVEKTEYEEESKAESENDKDQDNDTESHGKDQVSTVIFPSGDQSEILNGTNAQNGAWSTQASESQNEKESQQSSITTDQHGHLWKILYHNVPHTKLAGGLRVTRNWVK